MVSGVTDYLDGKIARAWGQTSKLGHAARPRGRPALHPGDPDRPHGARRRTALADPRAGRPRRCCSPSPCRCCSGTATARCRCTTSARPRPSTCCARFPLLLLGEWENAVGDVAHAFGWAFAIWGTALYWWAGILYLVQVRDLVAGPAEPRGPDRAPDEGGWREGGRDGRRRGHPPAPDDGRACPSRCCPIVNKPIMEHVLRLLARHGFSETVVTVQFLASLVRNYFGDGEDLGMNLHYATEETPLGTAGSVKNAEDLLRDDTFLVISGDALTDFDLTDLVKFHHDKEALVTVCLTRVPDPLEFGITIVDDDEPRRSASWRSRPGARCSPTPSTPASTSWSRRSSTTSPPASRSTGPATCSRSCWRRACRSTATSPRATGRTSARHESLHAGAGRRPHRQVDVDLDAFEISTGVWVAEGADVAPERDPQGPAVRRRLRQGRGRRRAARVHRARQQRHREVRRVPAPGRRARQRLHRAADQPARPASSARTPT